MEVITASQKTHTL